MKKTITLMMALATVTGSAAAQDYRVAGHGEGVPTFREVLKNTADKLPARKSSEMAGIITEAPEGDAQVYTLEAYSFYVAMGSYVGFEEVSTAREAVVTEDAIYLQGPLGAYDQGTYMKAEKKDDTTYVVKLPCPIYTETYMDWQANEEVTVDYQLCIMDGVRDENGEITSYVPSEETEVELKYEDGVITLDLGYEPIYFSTGELVTPERILGVSVASNGNWAGYGDAGFTWTPFEEQVMTPPADIEIEEWVLSSNGLGRTIRVGFSGDEVWIGDLNTTYLPDSWVRGEIKDDKVIIESGQYMGVLVGQFVYFVNATLDIYSKATVVDSYEYNYDREKKTFRADNPDMIIAISASRDAVIDWTRWANPTFSYQPEKVDPTPLNPFNLQYADWFTQYGYSTFSFEESNINANGHLLDTDSMYYRIYFDDEIVEFGSEDYPEYSADFAEPTADVPFNYNGSYFWTWDLTHQFMIYVQGMSTIGVQIISVVDGATYCSDVVTLDLENGDVTVGVDGIEAASEVMNVQYYDLNGRKVANPTKGIYVCKETMTDGKVRSYKVMR